MENDNSGDYRAKQRRIKEDKLFPFGKSQAQSWRIHVASLYHEFRLTTREAEIITAP